MSGNLKNSVKVSLQAPLEYVSKTTTGTKIGQNSKKKTVKVCRKQLELTTINITKTQKRKQNRPWP